MRRPDGSYRHLRKSVNEPGHAHELTFSCFRRLPLLAKDRSRVWFVEAIDRARQHVEFDVWAYVVMPDHAHILIMPHRAGYRIDAVLKAVKQSFSRRARAYLDAAAPAWLDSLAVERADGRIEHRFWQRGGGYDRNIVEPATAWASVNYLHHNPVRRGWVSRPEDWTWSSARWYAGEKNVPLAMDSRPPQSPVR